MDDDQQSLKEGELLPKGDEMPPWLGDTINRWIDAEYKKHQLVVAAGERAEHAERRFAWALLIFTLGSLVALYVSGNRSDAISVATHALAVFFGFGIAAIRGARRSSECPRRAELTELPRLAPNLRLARSG